MTDAATTHSQVQAITIARPRPDVMRLFQDAELLAEVFGDFAPSPGALTGVLAYKGRYRGSDGCIRRSATIKYNPSARDSQR